MSGTVFIVEDDPAVRDAMVVLTHSIGLTPRDYATAESFLQHYSQEHPACLITDVCLPGADGIYLQEHLIEQHIDIPTIVVSGHGDISMAVKMVRRGALDFLEKPFRNHVLIKRIREAIKLDEDKEQLQSAKRHWLDLYGALTPREQQIAKLLAKGNPNKTIANQVHLSPRTVETHRANILKKLELQSIAALAENMTLFSPEETQQQPTS